MERLVVKGRRGIRMMVKLTVMCGIISATALAQQPTSQAQQRGPERILAGTLTSPRNSSVVQVLGRDSGSTTLCSGTVLTSTAVLTAWHCIPQVISTMSVVAGSRHYRVRRVAIHPNLRVDNSTGIVYNDIAIVHLQKKMVAPTLALVSRRKVQRGDFVEIMGYGEDEFGRSGFLREGASEVVAVSSSHVVTLYDGIDSNTCYGDSGGPAILTFQGSDGVSKHGLVGVVSTGELDNCGVGDRTYFINTQSSRVLSFIKRQVPKVRVY